MASISIRGLDEEVRERLRARAAEHGRSMEAEARAILTEVVTGPSERGLAQALRARFSGLGGVDLQLPRRSEPPRAADFG